MVSFLQNSEESARKPGNCFYRQIYLGAQVPVITYLCNWILKTALSSDYDYDIFLPYKVQQIVNKSNIYAPPCYHLFTRGNNPAK